jgi:hypothetical protein
LGKSNAFLNVHAVNLSKALSMCASISVSSWNVPWHRELYVSGASARREPTYDVYLSLNSDSSVLPVCDPSCPVLDPFNCTVYPVPSFLLDLEQGSSCGETYELQQMSRAS